MADHSPAMFPPAELSHLTSAQVEMCDEASLFFAMTHNLHHQYWESCYGQELQKLLTLARNVPTEQRVAVSRAWFGLDAVQRALAMLAEEPVQRRLPVLDAGCGNGQLCHTLLADGFSAVHGLDYSEAAIAVAVCLANDYQQVVKRSPQGQGEDAQELQVFSGADAEEEELETPGLHLRCGDILDPPYEPGTFGLVVDKGVLDCVGMQVPAGESFAHRAFGELYEQSEKAWPPPIDDDDDENVTPVQAWCDSMYRLLAPGGLLLLLSCCFPAEEVQDALQRSESMFADGFEFRLLRQEVIQQLDTPPLNIMLLQKVESQKVESHDSASD